MAQRQFRSDDTSVWVDKYGTGSAGAYSSSGSVTDSTANTTITGTASSTSATVASGSGFSDGDLILIHQTQGTGANAWELNKISSGASTTSWTLAYALMNSYATGAQVYRLIQYTTATIGSGHTITAQSWSGTKGGIYALLASQSITISGSINAVGGNGSGAIVATGVGFQGGHNEEPPGVGSQSAQQGESSTGVGAYTTSANGAAGGGGHEQDGSGAGGGGGHAISGGGGFATGSATAGSGGGTDGNAGLTSMAMGAGGGGAAVQVGNVGGVGGNGGGIVILIAPTITVTGSISVNGGNGSTQNSFGGGGGAGGSVLAKGISVTLGTNLVTAAGGTQGTSGGSGGYGRIHIDYGSTISGSNSNPSFDTRQDTTLLASSGGGLILTIF